MKRDYGIHMKGGIITERDADYCTVRVRLPAGILSIEQMRGIARIAKKYQAGEVHLTTRQTIEIPHVDHRLITKIARDLSKNGTPLGSERDEIVNITACPGTDRCKYANIDTVTLARDLDSRLFGKEMPVKVRIALSACPYACTSPVLNEIGVIGRIKPVRTPGLCTGCGTCADYCRECAISIRNGISYVDESKCVLCGVCVQSCPFDLLKTEDAHYLITVGGRRGRHPKLGRELVEVATAEETIAIIERIVYWIYRRAWSGRLLSDQLDDIQFDAFKKEILETVENKTGK
ncbi:MAG: 4Fe-4S binding protein [Methanomicrobiaceae archaeon]|nr:4Fe-4S binding protein [Methanomicrobiaceae archaeon]